MKLLIVGATGGTGRHLVKQAIDRGHAVTALVRDPARAPQQHPRLTIIRGNVLDEDAVHAAVAGQEAVVSTLGHKRWFYPNRILSKGTEHIVRAMQAHGVRRFVCETSLGVGSSFGRLGLYYTLFTIPIILPFYYWDKGRQEGVIRRSDLDWIIVRPGLLNNRPARGKVKHGIKVGNWLWTVRISRADVATFMLDQLSDDTYLHQTPGVAW